MRDATREVEDPRTGRSVYEAWREHGLAAKSDVPGTARQRPSRMLPAKPRSTPSAPARTIPPSFDHAGIPSMDMGFNGDYGVYHSTYDDFYWMKHFGDPKFAYHATLAKIIGHDGAAPGRSGHSAVQLSGLRAGARAYHHGSHSPRRRAMKMNRPSSRRLDGAAKLSISAKNASRRAAGRFPARRSIPQKPRRSITRSRLVEQAFLAPEGLVGRPWFQHVLYAPGKLHGLRLSRAARRNRSARPPRFGHAETRSRRRSPRPAPAPPRSSTKSPVPASDTKPPSSKRSDPKTHTSRLKSSAASTSPAGTRECSPPQSAASATTIDQYTPLVRIPSRIASHYASGISNSQ